MKYKVSLLPEVQRKRLDGKKKSEKIQVYALVAMMVLLGALIVTLVSWMFAQNKLKKITAENSKNYDEVAELKVYQDLNAALDAKKERIESIEVKEPELTNFLANLSNMQQKGLRTGISFTSITCSDWQTSRVCSLVGTAISRDAYLAFEENLKSIDGVSGVTNSSYVPGTETQSGLEEFTVVINCGGGMTIVTPTEGEAEGAVEGETTEVAQ